MRQDRISRRVIVCVALIIALLTVEACAKPTTSPTATVPQTTAAPKPTSTAVATPTPTPSPKPSPTVAPIKPTGKLVVGMQDMGTEAFDPIKTSTISKRYLDIFYDYLVGMTPDASKISKDTGIAQDWSQSADGLTWTFTLRKGAKFHDGTEVTAKDVKFSLERAAGKDSVSSDKGNLAQWFDTITVVDPYTVAIKCKSPVPTLPDSLSTIYANGAAIVPKDYFERVGDKEFLAKPVGSGAYTIEERQTGDHITFKAISGEHFALGVPKYERVTLKLVPEESSQIAMLKRGDMDVIFPSLERALELKGEGYPTWEKKSDKVWGVMFQQLWNKTPLQDKRVREALGLAVNAQEMLQYLFKGYGTLDAGFIASSITQGHQPRAVLPYDPAKAKQLLAEAGYPKFKLYAYATTKYMGMPQINEMLATYWSAIGLDVQVVNMDWAGLRTKIVEKSTLDPSVRGEAAVCQSIVGEWSLYFSSKGVLAIHKDDTQLDTLVTNVLTSKTTGDFAKAQTAIEGYLYDNRLTLGFFETSNFVVTSKAITKWNPGYGPRGFPGLLGALSTK